MIGAIARLRAGLLAVRLEDSDMLRRGRLLAAELLVLGAVVLVYIVVDLSRIFAWGGPGRVEAGASLSWEAVAAGLIAALFMLNRSGKVRAAAVIFLLAGIAAPAFRYSGAAFDQCIPMYFLPIVSASFVLAPVASVLSCAIALGAYVGGYFAWGDGNGLDMNFLLFSPAIAVFCAVAGQQLQTAIERSRGLLQGANEDRRFLREQVSQRLRTEYRLADSLREKDLLLREVHHRVKNNLQVISSLVSLQANRSGAQRAEFAPLESRVKAMALVHGLLYEAEDFSSIDLREFAERLFLDLAGELERTDARLEYEIAPIRIGIATAVPVGLVLNEALRNALLHGVPADGGRQVVRVVLRVRESEGLSLSVIDNGAGVGEPGKGQGLGLKIVEVLSGQIDGGFSLETGPSGTVFRIDFS